MVAILLAAFGALSRTPGLLANFSAPFIGTYSACPLWQDLDSYAWAQFRLRVRPPLLIWGFPRFRRFF